LFQSRLVGIGRHAGLVPASTVPHTQRPLVKYHGGCRDEPGMTKRKAQSTATIHLPERSRRARDQPRHIRTFPGTDRRQTGPK